MKSLKQQAISGLKWNAFESITNQGIQFLISIVLARLLTPEDFGIVGLLTVFIVISNAFIDGGFTNALVRKTDKTEVDYSTAFYFNIVIGLICYVSLFILSPYIANFFEIEILDGLLKILALSLLFNSFAIVQLAKLTSDVDFKTQAIATFLAVILSGCFGVALAYLGYGVWALVLQTVSLAFLKTVFLIIQTKWLPKLLFSLDSFKYQFSYGSKLVASNLLYIFYNQLTTILVGKFYKPAELGLYTQGRHFPNFITNTFVGVLGKVTFPILAKLQSDDVELTRVYRKMIRLTSLVSAFGLLLLASLAKPLVLFLLTDKWVDCVVYLQLFCFAMITDHLSRINLNLLQVKGRSDLYLRLEVYKRILSIALMLIALPYGVIYLCVSLIVYSQIALVINCYYTGKLFHIGYFTQMQDFFKYFGLAVISVLPTYLLTFSSLPPIIMLIIGVGLSISIYYSLLRNDENMIELVNRLFSILKGDK